MRVEIETTYNLVCDSCSKVLTLYEMPNADTIQCPHCNAVNVIDAAPQPRKAWWAIGVFDEVTKQYE